MKKLLKKKKGFTLIELLICLFIIGLMMLLIIPNIANQRKEAQKKSDAAIVKVIENQQELYLLDNKEATESTGSTVDKNAKPTPETLQKNGYITQEQLEAYNKVQNKPKTNSQ
jgi:competence protein